MSGLDVSVVRSADKRRLQSPSVSKTGGASLAWVISFGDLLTLILCFFVLLLSVKPIEIVKKNAGLPGAGETLDETPPNGTSLAGATQEGVRLSFFRQLRASPQGAVDIPLRGDITRPGGPEGLVRQLKESSELQQLAPRSVRLVLCGVRERRGDVVGAVSQALRGADVSALPFSLESRMGCEVTADNEEKTGEQVGVLVFSHQLS